MLTALLIACASPACAADDARLALEVRNDEAIRDVGGFAIRSVADLAAAIARICREDEPACALLRRATEPPADAAEMPFFCEDHLAEGQPLPSDCLWEGGRENSRGERR
ncbi:MAG TPA: hypothetical protein VEA60_10265 [Allosphingosinicella sp.]|nr:hypothetical protein [Allosphingosinicella sp.]